MNSRKTLLREQNIIEFIDDKIVTSRLNYPNIRDRVKFMIGEKELVKNKLFYKVVVRLSFSLSVIMVCVMAFLTIIGNKGIYATVNLNPALTNSVTVRDLPTGSHSINNSKIDIYDFIYYYDRLDYNTNDTFEIDVPSMNEGKYYCGYVSKDVMNYIKAYLNVEFNTYNKTYMYRKFCFFYPYRGIDDLLVKYNYFCATRKIDMNEGEYALKWATFDSVNDIKAEIDNNQLIVVTNIRKIDQITTIKDGSKVNSYLNCVTELEAEIVDKKVNIKNKCQSNLNEGRYVLKLNLSSIKEDIYPYDNFLNLKCLDIKQGYDFEYLEGTISSDYLKHMNNCHADGSSCEHSIYEKKYKAIQILDQYKIFEEEAIDNFGELKIKVYYDYNGVKKLFQN